MTPVSASPLPAPSTVHSGLHPRPQLQREAWTDLCGPWQFAADDGDVGLLEAWFATDSPFDRTILVPFPPESSASGIAEKGFHPTVWYRRELTAADAVLAGRGRQGDRLLLHFGAVDYTADVWLGGQYLGRHEGGHTPFTFDVTVALGDLDARGSSVPLVVRAHDDPHDVAQPRGKQDWQSEPHGIWYQRTTGIWQPVWLEAVPAVFVRDLSWDADVTHGSVDLALELSGRPARPAWVSVSVTYAGDVLADLRFLQAEPRSTTTIRLPGQSNGQAHESLLWSTDNPRLLDVRVEVELADGSVDRVDSYVGVRSVGWSGGHFLLNDRPCYVRAVLGQGYWPATHLAAPDAPALRAEVQLILDLGFNTVRVHQKIEDPRFLYWCDRLGLMVWAESASAYEFSSTAVARVTGEWVEAVRRDVSHPCIVAWVPLNESWGVQHIAHDARQLHHAQALYHLTRSLDCSRPVISNDGWEHADSDMWTIHDYGVTGPEVAANYVDRAAVTQLLDGVGPLGRRMRLLDRPDRGQPVIVSEFGGVGYAPAYDGASWSYVTTSEPADFESLLRELFSAVQSSPVLAGFCYTQLTDTLQETNGLADELRRPKLPVEVLRAIVLGKTVDGSAHRRPRSPVEQATPPVGS